MDIKLGDVVMFTNSIAPLSPGPYPDALVEVVQAPSWSDEHEQNVAWFADKLNAGVWVRRVGTTIDYRAKLSELSPAPELPSVTDQGE